LSVLIAAANFAVRKGELSKNDVPVIELPPASAPRDRWLTDDEVAALFNAARARRDGRLSRAERFLWLAYYTAARKGALLDLRWPQVDFDTKVIHLNPPGRKQTKKRRASVPIADDLLPVLRQAHKERNGEYVLDHGGSIRRGFGTLVKAAGLKGVTPHTLRHTAATHMARAGVDLWIIANVLGDTLTTTEKNYAHHNPDFARRGVSALNRRMQAI
jgi:integrase